MAVKQIFGRQSRRRWLIALCCIWLFTLATVKVQIASTVSLGSGAKLTVARRTAKLPRCGQLSGLVDCVPQFDGFVHCHGFCRFGEGSGEHCQIDVRLDTEDPFIRRGVITWWVFQDLDGRMIYVYDDTFSASLWNSVRRCVLCDRECWAGIVGLGWAYANDGSSSVIAELKANDCLDCRTPTPAPRPTTEPPSLCFPWLHSYLPMTSTGQ